MQIVDMSPLDPRKRDDRLKTNRILSTALTAMKPEKLDPVIEFIKFHRLDDSSETIFWGLLKYVRRDPDLNARLEQKLLIVGRDFGWVQKPQAL